MNTIAILADLHLPERTDTVKETVFDWALQEAMRQGAELLAGAGDMTSLGTTGAARRLVDKMAATGLPFLNAPGNAEWRCRHQTADVLALLTVTGRKIPTVTVLGVQPYDLEAGVELSDEMKALVPEVVEEALAELRRWGIEATPKEHVSAVETDRVAEAIAGKN